MHNQVGAQWIQTPRDACDGGSEARHGSVGVPAPRVFCQKSVDLLESKGDGFLATTKSLQECEIKEVARGEWGRARRPKGHRLVRG
jgi:hypothetical protein